ncbi:hypothetical protein ACP4OV_023783 [Aristida adscensionis]
MHGTDPSSPCMHARTQGNPALIPSAHGRLDNLANTAAATNSAAVPAMEFPLGRAPPPFSGKAKSNWPAFNGFSARDTIGHQRGGDSHERSALSSPPPVDSNVSAMEAPPALRRRREEHYSGVPRRRPGIGKSRSAAKPGKPLCSYHRTPASFLHGRVECSGVVVVMFAGSALLVFLCTLAGAGLLMLCVHGKRRGEATGAEADLEDDVRERLAGRRPELLRRAAGPRRYGYRTLAAAVGNFAESRRIGRGGFGSVYRGYLDDQGRQVAVKVFSPTAASPPEQGRREFEAEVEVMGHLRHRNVLQLVGWCDGRRGLLLAYELAPGGTLDKMLYDPERILTWHERYKIALGLGAAILYLHTECEQCVVHGDIKPSNVMLDASCSAKLGDFGLARLLDHGAEPRTTQVVAGTVGYVDPELVGDRKHGPESDVYSFGVVLLEIACGVRPTTASVQPKKDDEGPRCSRLLKRVRDMYARDTVLGAADRRLDGAFDERQMERVLVTGLWCAQPDRSRRPSIAQAMDVLRCDTKVMLPAHPAVAGLDDGSGHIRVLEARAYGDLSGEDDVESSTAGTAYHSPEDSSYLSTEE